MIRHRRSIVAVLAALVLVVLAGCKFPGAGVSVSFTSPTPAEDATVTDIAHPYSLPVTVAASGASPDSFTLTNNGTAVSGVTHPTDYIYNASVPLYDGENVLVAHAVVSGITYATSRHIYYRQKANLVMGQASMTSSTPATTVQRTDGPAGAAAAVGGHIYIPDTQNNRVVGYSTMPSANNVFFDYVLGHNDFTTKSAAPIGPSALNVPAAVADSTGDLVVADTGYSRVLFWNGAPTTPGAPASIAVGQASPSSAPLTTCDASHLNHPEGVAVAGGRLIVADTQHNRVLVWNSVPSQSGTDANIVLGQADASHCSENRGSAVAANSLSAPSGVWSNGTKLIVADTGNNRVLIWDSFPTQNGEAADHVVGQPSLTDGTLHAADDDSSSASVGTGLHSPKGVWSDGTQLFVADTGYNRVAVFGSVPNTNGTRASEVLGQSSLSGTSSNDGGMSASSLSGPRGVRLVAGYLIVADTGNSRELRFNW